MTPDKRIILFDGVCNFCSFWVDSVIRKDKKDLFRVAALQSEAAKSLSEKLNFDSTTISTFILIADKKLFTKSTAALMVCKELSSPLKLLYPFIILPKSFRDLIYDFISRHRYKIFGKRNVCRVPTEADKAKFL